MTNKLYYFCFLPLLSSCYVTTDTERFQCDEFYMVDYNCNLTNPYNFIQFTPRVPRSPYWDSWGYPTQYYYDMGCPDNIVFPQVTYPFFDYEESEFESIPRVPRNNNIQTPNEPSTTKPNIKPRPNLNRGRVESKKTVKGGNSIKRNN